MDKLQNAPKKFSLFSFAKKPSGNKSRAPSSAPSANPSVASDTDSLTKDGAPQSEAFARSKQIKAKPILKKPATLASADARAPQAQKGLVERTIRSPSNLTFEKTRESFNRQWHAEMDTHPNTVSQKPNLRHSDGVQTKTINTPLKAYIDQLHAPESQRHAVEVLKQAIKANKPIWDRANRMMVWPNGQMYHGEFNPEGKPNNWGQLTLANGNAYRSTWRNGQCVELDRPLPGDTLADAMPVIKLKRI